MPQPSGCWNGSLLLCSCLIVLSCAIALRLRRRGFRGMFFPMAISIRHMDVGERRRIFKC